MQSCDICGITSTEVRIFDAIYDLRMSTLCERCSIIENIPIIKKPNSEQLKESETNRVSDRMKDISGIKGPEQENTFFKEDKLKELDKNPELELPEKENLNLIENYHWEIMKQRRKRGLSQIQLAESIGESETSIQMIEKSRLPENAKNIINKLEQIFQANLRMKKDIILANNDPIVVNYEGHELSTIPEEEEMIFIEEVLEAENTKKSVEQISLEHAENALGIKIPNEKPKERILYLPQDRDLDLNKINQKEVTIKDLQELHDKRSEVVKGEQLKEQRMIEDRQRLLKESRERDQQRIEEQKQQELLEKENEEQRRNQLIEQKRYEVQALREQESKDINNFLGGSELLDQTEEPKKDNLEEFDRELN